MTWRRRCWPLLLTMFAGAVALAAGTATASPEHPAATAQATVRGSANLRARRSPVPTPATRISGRIVDDQGNPLAGVVVHVRSAISYADHHTAWTGTDGRYSIGSTPGPERVTLDGSKATGGDADGVGYVGTRSAVVTATYGRTTSGVDASMHAGGEIRGRVTDTAGHPLNGVSSWLTDIQPYVYSESDDYPQLAAGTERVASRDGRFRIGGVRPGAYELCFDTTSSQVVGGTSDRSGYESTCGSRVVTAATNQVTDTGTLPLTRSDGGVVFGQVTGRDGRPVAGVLVATRVKHHYSDAVTGRNGFYRIQDLPTGALRVCYLTDFVDTSTPTGFAPVCPASRLAVTTGQSYHVDRTLAPGGAIRGIARSTGGVPLAGMIVEGTLGPEYGIDSVVTETNDAGHYVLKNLAAPHVEVCFSPDFSTAAGPGDPFGAVSERSCRSVQAHRSRMTSGVSKSFARAGGISGTLRDQNGRPLRNVQVDLEGNTDYGDEGEFYSVTDAHGHYRGVDLPPINFVVCYSSRSFFEKCYRKPGATHISEVRVHRNKNVAGVDETLSTAHHDVRVAVVDSDGDPLSGADAVLLARCSDPTKDDECLAQPPAGQQTYTVDESGVTDAQGRISWPVVDKGTYTVCAFGYYAAMPTGAPPTGFGDSCAAARVTVARTSDQRVRIVLPTDGAVTGRVTNSAGRPLADVRVHISASAADDFADPNDEGDTRTPRWDAYTDANGDYTIRSVAPGARTACFDPRRVAGATAYQPQCLDRPPGTTRGGATVSVTTGTTTTGIDMALSPKPAGAARPARAFPTWTRSLTTRDSSCAVDALDAVLDELQDDRGR